MSCLGYTYVIFCMVWRAGSRFDQQRGNYRKDEGHSVGSDYFVEKFEVEASKMKRKSIYQRILHLLL